jgi:hypothetical protein
MYVAVNTTDTAPGAFGAEGVGAVTDQGNIEPEIFAESSIPLSIFTGGSSCGASYFGTVITRPSGSGGTSPDLKDLAGPAIFNFGQPEVAASLQPTCDLAFLYHVDQVLGLDRTPLDEGAYTCHWDFYDSSDQLIGASETCAGVHSVATADSYYGVASIELGDLLSCGDSETTEATTLFAPITAIAHAAGTCDGAEAPYVASFNFWGDVEGGSGEFDYLWTFTGADDPACITNPATSAALPDASEPGIVAVDTGATTYLATLNVTDRREGVVDAEGNPVVCSDDDEDTAVPYAPLTVSLELTASAMTCPDISTDAALYTAVVSGGDGNYVYDWTNNSCDGADQCTIDPDDSNFCYDTSLQVTVDDGVGLCEAVASEVETYHKVTIVEASDN